MLKAFVYDLKTIVCIVVPLSFKKKSALSLWEKSECDFECKNGNQFVVDQKTKHRKYTF